MLLLPVVQYIYWYDAWPANCYRELVDAHALYSLVMRCSYHGVTLLGVCCHNTQRAEVQHAVPAKCLGNNLMGCFSIMTFPKRGVKRNTSKEADGEVKMC